MSSRQFQDDRLSLNSSVSSGSNSNNTTRLNEFLCETIKRARDELSAGNYQGVVNITNVVISSYWGNNNYNNSPSNTSFSSLNINNDGGINANNLQLSRIYILQCEAFSKIGDIRSALRAAEQAARVSKYQNPHAVFILARELIHQGRVKDSIAMFEKGENLILSGVKEFKVLGSSDAGECWASLGFDPECAPSNVMPPDNIDTIASTSDDEEEGRDKDVDADMSEGVKENNVSDSPCSPCSGSGKHHEDQQNVLTTSEHDYRIGNTNFVNDCCINYSAVSSAHLLSQPHVKDWVKELRKLLRFRDEAIIMANLLDTHTTPTSYNNHFLANFTLDTRPNCTREHVIKIRNYSETPLVYFCEKITCGNFVDDLKLPTIIRGGELGIAAIEGTSKWKGFTAIMCYSFGSTTSQPQVFRSSSTQKKTHSDRSVARSDSDKQGPMAIILWVEAPLLLGSIKAAVRVEPLVNVSRSRFADLMKHAEIDESSKPLNASVPPVGAGSRTPVYDCRHAFSPIVYFTHCGEDYKLIAEQPPSRSQMFSLVKVRRAKKYIRMPEIGNNSTADKRDKCATNKQCFNQLLNDVDLISIFEFIPTDHRYRVAMASRKCRRLMNSLPPTASYGPINCQCTYPAYAIRDDFFDSPWTVRDMGTITLKVLSDGPITLLVDNNKNTIFSFVSNVISGGVECHVFFGVGRKTLVMRVEELWSVFVAKKVKLKAACAGAPDIGVMSFISDDTFTFTPSNTCFISDKKSYPPVTLYTVKRRMNYEMIKRLEEVVISFLGDSGPNVATFMRTKMLSNNPSNSTDGLCELGELTVSQGIDLLMVFTLMAYSREITIMS